MIPCCPDDLSFTSFNYFDLQTVTGRCVGSVIGQHNPNAVFRSRGQDFFNVWRCQPSWSRGSVVDSVANLLQKTFHSRWSHNGQHTNWSVALILEGVQHVLGNVHISAWSSRNATCLAMEGKLTF